MPDEDDGVESLAGALWLDEHHQKSMAIAVNQAIARAFGGSK